QDGTALRCANCGWLRYPRANDADLIPTRRPVMNSPADEAEARDRANTAPPQADPDARCRGETGTSSGSEARPVTATAHPSNAESSVQSQLATLREWVASAAARTYQPTDKRRYAGLTIDG